MGSLARQAWMTSSRPLPLSAGFVIQRTQNEWNIYGSVWFPKRGAAILCQLLKENVRMMGIEVQVSLTPQNEQHPSCHPPGFVHFLLGGRPTGACRFWGGVCCLGLLFILTFEMKQTTRMIELSLNFLTPRLRSGVSNLTT